VHARLTTQAILWAIEKKVHIISMSWTIQKTPDNDADFERLSAAIKKAQDAGILMFGAASDQGFNNAINPYPAKAPGVICIGAAKWSGHVEEAAERDADYVFPGGTFTLPPSQTNHDKQPQQVSGSSFATALASGLTALILYCVEINLSPPPGPPGKSDSERPPSPQASPSASRFSREHRKRLQNSEIIKEIFAHMAQNGSKYIAVNQVFRATWADKKWNHPMVQDSFYADVEFIIR
jgi:hypothetical protein